MQPAKNYLIKLCRSVGLFEHGLVTLYDWSPAGVIRCIRAKDDYLLLEDGPIQMVIMQMDSRSLIMRESASRSHR